MNNKCQLLLLNRIKGVLESQLTLSGSYSLKPRVLIKSLQGTTITYAIRRFRNIRFFVVLLLQGPYVHKIPRSMAAVYIVSQSCTESVVYTTVQWTAIIRGRRFCFKEKNSTDFFLQFSSLSSSFCFFSLLQFSCD